MPLDAMIHNYNCKANLIAVADPVDVCLSQARCRERVSSQTIILRALYLIALPWPALATAGQNHLSSPKTYRGCLLFVERTQDLTEFLLALQHLRCRLIPTLLEGTY